MSLPMRVDTGLGIICKTGLLRSRRHYPICSRALSCRCSHCAWGAAFPRRPEGLCKEVRKRLRAILTLC